MKKIILLIFVLVLVSFTAFAQDECFDLDNDGFKGHSDSCFYGLDCDDNNFDIKPNATEICDNIDNDCDSFVDEGCNCIDNDNDSYNSTFGCGVIDCDDNDANNFPKNKEQCDGKDNNCDGFVDEECLTCLNDAGCYDFDACTTDRCVDGECRFENITNCDLTSLEVDIQICQNKESFKDICFTFVAINYGNLNVCDYILDLESREICKDFVREQIVFLSDIFENTKKWVKEEIGLLDIFTMVKGWLIGIK